MSIPDWRSVASDIAFTLRNLRKAPGFFLIAMLAIVLGVSSSTTVFSLINAVLIRPLPYGHPESLHYIWAPLVKVAGVGKEFAPFQTDVLAMQRSNHSFVNITAVDRYLAFVRGAHPFRAGAARVLGNFFQTMEVRAEIGRVLLPQDDLPGSPLVAAISDDLWRSQFGADPNIIGRVIQIDKRKFRLVGVIEQKFTYPQSNDFPGQYQFAWLHKTDIWTPAAITSQELATPDFNFSAVIGRLPPGASPAAAQIELSALQDHLALQHPASIRRAQILLTPFVESTFGPVRPLLRLLTGAVSLVLLLSCANFAGLLMARASNRAHEFGIRSALGARRSRLVRLLLTE
jgi:ABC-type antimicrobial peptide transport system permease subunit